MITRSHIVIKHVVVRLLKILKICSIFILGLSPVMLFGLVGLLSDGFGVSDFIINFFIYASFVYVVGILYFLATFVKMYKDGIIKSRAFYKGALSKQLGVFLKEYEKHQLLLTSYSSRGYSIKKIEERVYNCISVLATLPVYSKRFNVNAKKLNKELSLLKTDLKTLLAEINSSGVIDSLKNEINARMLLDKINGLMTGSALKNNFKNCFLLTEELSCLYGITQNIITENKFDNLDYINSRVLFFESKLNDAEKNESSIFLMKDIAEINKLSEQLLNIRIEYGYSIEFNLLEFVFESEKLGLCANDIIYSYFFNERDEKLIKDVREILATLNEVVEYCIETSYAIKISINIESINDPLEKFIFACKSKCVSLFFKDVKVRNLFSKFDGVDLYDILINTDASKLKLLDASSSEWPCLLDVMNHTVDASGLKEGIRKINDNRLFKSVKNYVLSQKSNLSEQERKLVRELTTVGAW